MLLVFRPLFDPSADRLFLGAREGFVVLRRRHHLIHVLGENAQPRFAFAGISRNNRRIAPEVGPGSLLRVETEVGLAFLGVKAVAGEAGV